MEFCPKCGSVLLPTKKGRSFKLVCSKCSYKRQLKGKKDMKGYKISEEVKKKDEIAIVDADQMKKKKPEQLEREKIEYYEELYE